MLSLGKVAVGRVMASPGKAPARRSKAAVEYTYSDGTALAESPRHFDTIPYAMAILRNRIADSRFVQVGASMNLFYEEGDPTKKLMPDLFVARGLESLPEPSYGVWEAGKPPGFVLEVAPPSNAERDLGAKQAL